MLNIFCLLSAILNSLNNIDLLTSICYKIISFKKPIFPHHFFREFLYTMERFSVFYNAVYTLNIIYHFGPTSMMSVHKSGQTHNLLILLKPRKCLVWCSFICEYLSVVDDICFLFCFYMNTSSRLSYCPISYISIFNK